MSNKDKGFWWFIGCFIAAAAIGGGGTAASSGGGSHPQHDTPKPQHSAVCNQYFKGGC
jgi:hypothetical protein